KSGRAERTASFHLFFRRPPFRGGFTVACGLEAVIDFIANFSFSESDIAYLASIKNPSGAPYFEASFLDMLKALKLTVSIDAVPEGTAVFPHEPLLRVEGPLLQCQLLESTLLNLINFPTLIATKAARICLAAQGDPVFEFGLRRAQGVDGALTASRAAYVGGCCATSNVLAGKTFGIPTQGTLAHSLVMAFDNEEEAFMAYATALPEACVFLVDTYDTISGVKNAIKVGRWLESQGKKMMGIRLDSGDLAQLSIESRKLLDAAGFTDVKIVASNELDEVIISELKHQGAKISVWGVGTNLVTGKEQPALDGVYKLSALKDVAGQWKHVLKLSEQLAKVSNPGRLQVKRFSYEGKYVADVLYDV
ncbi:MAG: nicotinate phosphoribosyltransferase, partial [Verrucomicrobia bacterium]|nr:nicotinate phosphoribosyltransferase [Verrucomicrobiota bacterium]